MAQPRYSPVQPATRAASRTCPRRKTAAQEHRRTQASRKTSSGRSAHQVAVVRSQDHEARVSGDALTPRAPQSLATTSRSAPVAREKHAPCWQARRRGSSCERRRNLETVAPASAAGGKSAPSISRAHRGPGSALLPALRHAPPVRVREDLGLRASALRGAGLGCPPADRGAAPGWYCSSCTGARRPGARRGARVSVRGRRSPARSRRRRPRRCMALLPATREHRRDGRASPGRAPVNLAVEGPESASLIIRALDGRAKRWPDSAGQGLSAARPRGCSICPRPPYGVLPRGRPGGRAAGQVTEKRRTANIPVSGFAEHAPHTRPVWALRHRPVSL